MPKNTPSMAKNQMNRCFHAILDLHPSRVDVAQLWKFFKSSCAYCGVRIKASERNGHLDHVLAHAEGGSNNVHNYVLSCARCNGDEKRELDWKTFLDVRVSDESLRQARRTHIEEWMQRAPEGHSLVSPEVQQAANLIIARATKEFDVAVEQLRSLRINDS